MVFDRCLTTQTNFSLIHVICQTAYIIFNIRFRKGVMKYGMEEKRWRLLLIRHPSATSALGLNNSLLKLAQYLLSTCITKTPYLLPRSIPSFHVAISDWKDRATPCRYEGWSTHSHNHAISMQPLGIGHATIPHMKAMYVPFQPIYGSPI